MRIIIHNHTSLATKGSPHNWVYVRDYSENITRLFDFAWQNLGEPTRIGKIWVSFQEFAKSGYPSKILTFIYIYIHFYVLIDYYYYHALGALNISFY